MSLNLGPYMEGVEDSSVYSKGIGLQSNAITADRRREREVKISPLILLVMQ